MSKTPEAPVVMKSQISQNPGFGGPDGDGVFNGNNASTWQFHEILGSNSSTGPYRVQAADFDNDGYDEIFINNNALG